MQLQLGEVGVEPQPAVWDLTVRPHGLFVGETGAGKTYLASSVAVGALGQGARVWVADGKGGGDFARVGVDELAEGPESAVELLEAGADEVQRRMTVARAQSAAGVGERVLVVVDELAAIQLRRRGEDAKTARDRVDRFQSSLAEIALTGRAAGVHLLVLLQRPDASALPGSVRDQLGLRVALGWMSPDGYRMVFGSVDLQPPRCLEPGWGWISGYEGHRDGPRPFVAASESQQGRMAETGKGGSPCAGR